MLSCLVHDPAFSPNAKGSILPGLRLVHDPADLPDNTDAVKFFAGYAGWAPGQLDGELKAKAWLTHPATLAHVFDPRPEEQWRTILRGKGLQYRLLADAPEDVSLN
jgi:putative transcriptional regulator